MINRLKLLLFRQKPQLAELAEPDFCFICNTSTRQEPYIHFPLINSQFIPHPLPISLPFIMHYSPFLNDFLLTVSSNLVFGYG